ncbi:MAG: hypothetical protein IPM08_00450 [Actinomycetales bacterium]|nr:hypothetical protein [Actinomycetales bacterium]
MGLFGLPRSPRNSSATLDAHPSDSRSHAGLNGILPTPRLDLDPAVAVARFEELATALTGTGIRYAVKANPHPALLAQLAAAGCGFDAASPAEVDLALGAGAAAQTLIHSNPIARRADLAEVYRMGVRLFVVDATSEVDKLADVAPEAAVLIRLATTGEGSDWPLSRKYGCSADDAPRPALPGVPSRSRRGGPGFSTSAPNSGSRAPGTRRSRPPLRCLHGLVTWVWTRGSSTSAEDSRPGTRATTPTCRPTGQPSAPHWGAPSPTPTDGQRHSPSRAGASSATRGSS